MTIYYISSSDGNPANPGTKELPWIGVEQINDLAGIAGIFAGDIFLFKRGDTFIGKTINDTIQLRNFTGTVSDWVIFANYGLSTDANPIFDGVGGDDIDGYGLMTSFQSWDIGPTIANYVAFFGLDSIRMGSTNKATHRISGLAWHHHYVYDCNITDAKGSGIHPQDGSRFQIYENLFINGTEEEAMYLGNLESLIGEWNEDISMKDITVSNSVLEGMDIKKMIRAHLEDITVSKCGGLLPGGNDSFQVSGTDHNIINLTILDGVDDITKGGLYLSERADYPARDITVWNLIANELTGNTGSPQDNGGLRLLGSANNIVYNSSFTNDATGIRLSTGAQGLANSQVLGITYTNVTTEQQGSPGDVTVDAGFDTFPPPPAMPSIGQPSNPSEIEVPPSVTLAGLVTRIIPISLVGDLRKGGWAMSCRVENDTDIVERGDIVSFFAKTVYNPSDFQQYFTGITVANPDTISFNRTTSNATFVVATPDTPLSGESLQSIGFTQQISPTNDHQIVPPMKLANIVEHILKRHCNVVYDAVNNPGGYVTVLNILFDESVNLERYNVDKSNNMWRSIKAIGGAEKSGEFFQSFFNRKGEFFYQPAPFFWPIPPASKGTITKDHIIGTVKIKFNGNQPGGRVGQVAITSIKDSKTIFKSSYPAVMGEGKILPPIDGIFAGSQSDSNRHVERYYKWLTREYTLTLDVDPALILYGDDGVGLDLADKITVQYDGPAEDAVTGAGVHITINDDFYIYRANVKIQNKDRHGIGTLTLEKDNP